MPAYRGFILGAASAILNGSFVVFSKLPSVRQANVDPMVFQLYTCIGVYLSSLLTMPFFDGDKYPSNAIGLGICAGGLFVLAVCFSFLAVNLIGLSTGQSVWSGVAVVVSFLWGVIAFGDKVNPYLAAAGLIFIVIGVITVAFTPQIAKRVWGEESNLDGTNPDATEPILNDHLLLSTTSSSQPMFDDANILTPLGVSPLPSRRASESGGSFHTSTGDNKSSRQSKTMLFGLLSAFAVGASGGSILVPMQYVPKESAGIHFVPSFGLGALLVSPLITFPYMYFSRSRPSRGNWAFKPSILPGIAAGFMWNGANICSIFAIDDIGFAIAGPLMQCAIVVAATWGVVAFKEMRGKSVVVLAIAALIVLAGAALLAMSKIFN